MLKTVLKSVSSDTFTSSKLIKVIVCIDLRTVSYYKSHIFSINCENNELKHHFVILKQIKSGSKDPGINGINAEIIGHVTDMVSM